MGAMASQITSLTIVYWSVHSGADQRKYQSSASLAFVWGIHRWPMNSPHKRPVTRKMFPFDDVIMIPRGRISLSRGSSFWETIENANMFYVSLCFRKISTERVKRLITYCLQYVKGIVAHSSQVIAFGFRCDRLCAYSSWFLPGHCPSPIIFSIPVKHPWRMWIYQSPGGRVTKHNFSRCVFLFNFGIITILLTHSLSRSYMTRVPTD